MGLTSKFLEIVASTCTQIRKLVVGVKGNLWEKNITKIQNVNDEGILAVAKGCPFLRNINLNHCNQITDMALLHLAQNCMALRSLEIYGCTQIRVDGVFKALKDCIDRNSCDNNVTTWKTITSDLMETKIRWDKWNELIKEVDRKKKPYIDCPKPQRCYNVNSFAPIFGTAIVSV